MCLGKYPEVEDLVRLRREELGVRMERKGRDQPRRQSGSSISVSKHPLTIPLCLPEAGK